MNLVELQGIRWAQRNHLYFYIPVMKNFEKEILKKNPICKSPKSKISKDRLNQGHVNFTLITTKHC